MLTPYSLVVTARAVLLVMAPLAMLLAFTSAGRTMFAEGLLFLVVSMVIGQLGILALPWRRRNDTLKVIALVAIITASIRSGFTGDPAFMVTVPAALAGTAAVWFTLEIEQWRKLARTYGDTSFSVIRIETERRVRKKAQANVKAVRSDSAPLPDPAKPR